MSEDLVITDDNFNEYFHDVRKCPPQKGEIMVCYSSSAEFVDGFEKKQMVNLLKMEGKIEAATQIMRKLLFASELDAIRVPKAILKDLVSGMSEEEVSKKSYDYTVEMFFFTKPEYFPEGNPRWKKITILNMDEFLAKKEQMESEGSSDDGEE